MSQKLTSSPSLEKRLAQEDGMLHLHQKAIWIWEKFLAEFNVGERYGILKAVCQKMVPTIGSGRIITALIISNDGQPIQDPSTTSDDPTAVGFLKFDDGMDLDKRVIQRKLILHQIGLDVVRTDRALVFYENKENNEKLWDILSVYAWVDKDIGYCQGMNDLCSPMIVLLENEADAFWCFDHLMRRMRENFRCTASSIGVQSQLTTLSSIIKVVDPKLHQHLENLDGGEYLFAFRMLMVLFRREFSFVDSMDLWELMWAMEYNPNIFSLYQDSASPAADPSMSSQRIHSPLFLSFLLLVFLSRSTSTSG